MKSIPTSAVVAGLFLVVAGMALVMLQAELARLRQWAEDEKTALKARQEELRRRIAAAKAEAERNRRACPSLPRSVTGGGTGGGAPTEGGAADPLRRRCAAYTGQAYR